MKEKFNKYEVYITDNFNEINEIIKCKLPYPYTKEMFNLLKENNKYEQKYYYIKKESDYAFFTIYKERLNVFTFGKLKWFLNIKIIGYPCSLSNCGYVTNNEKMLFDYLKTLKGLKLILNVDNECNLKNMPSGETLPTCKFNNKYNNTNDYLNSLRSSYRRRINKAIKNCKDISVKEINDNSIDIYDLYLNTYNKSNYKLEKLEKGFFDNIDATKLVFVKDNKPVGFVLLKKNDENLIFMLCGMDYSIETADLYYYMLYNIICFGISNNCNYIDFGQTSEETKLKFGAYLQKKYFYVHHTNVIVNLVAKILKPALAYKYMFPKYNVFKEQL